MTLTWRSDLSAADWIVRSELPWQQLVGFGPAGFDSYARLRFLPDPTRVGQHENEVDASWRSDQQLLRLFEVLATPTTNPDDCYFCVWDGFADYNVEDDAAYEPLAHPLQERPDAQPTDMAPRAAASRPMPLVPKVVLPHREYWLFRGSLSEAGAWDTAQGWPGHCRLGEAEAAFVWPDDHAWCVAMDVDPHWAGIGGSPALIRQLSTDPLLDVVTADPTEEQPFYL